MTAAASGAEDSSSRQINQPTIPQGPESAQPIGGQPVVVKGLACRKITHPLPSIESESRHVGSIATGALGRPGVDKPAFDLDPAPITEKRSLTHLSFENATVAKDVAKTREVSARQLQPPTNGKIRTQVPEGIDDMFADVPELPLAPSISVPPSSSESPRPSPVAPRDFAPPGLDDAFDVPELDVVTPAPSAPSEELVVGGLPEPSAPPSQSAALASENSARTLVPEGIDDMFADVPDLSSATPIGPPSNESTRPSPVPHDFAPPGLDDAFDVPELAVATPAPSAPPEELVVGGPPEPSAPPEELVHGAGSEPPARALHRPTEYVGSHSEAALGDSRHVHWGPPVGEVRTPSPEDSEVVAFTQSLGESLDATAYSNATVQLIQKSDINTFLRDNPNQFAFVLKKDGGFDHKHLTEMTLEDHANAAFIAPPPPLPAGAAPGSPSPGPRIAAPPHVAHALMVHGEMHHRIPGLHSAAFHLITGPMIAHFSASLSQHVEQLKLSENNNKEKSSHVNTTPTAPTILTEMSTHVGGKTKGKVAVRAETPMHSIKKTKKNEALDIQKAATAEDREKQERLKQAAYRKEIKGLKDQHEENLKEVEKEDIEHTNRAREIRNEE